jgi:phytoene desaturase
MSKQVVIIGAGPGGLAAAMLLAKAGARVKVVERASHVGGRTSTISAGGFHFDLGPTFFLYPQVLEAIFRTVGRDLHAEVPMVRLDPQYTILFGAAPSDASASRLGASGPGASGGLERILATPNVAKLEAEVAKVSPRDARNVRRFLDDNRVKLRVMEPCLEMPYLGWGDVASLGMLRLVPTLRPWLSLDGDLKRYFKDPRIRLAFSFQSKYLGMSPYTCPSMFTILSFIEYEHGVFHPIGGCAAIPNAMARIARELGAEISLDDDVEQILFDGRKAVGVRSTKGTYEADAVVLNADFSRAMTRLVPDRLRRRWTDAKIARKRYSCSTFMLYLGIEGRYDHLTHHTIYISGDYVRNLDEIESRHVLSEDPSFYVQNACVSDPALAPPGMSTLYVLVPTTHMHPNVDWERERARYRTLVLRQIKKAGIEDVERRIRFERVIAPVDWERSEIYRGATFNLAHNLGQMLHLRPRNRFEDLDGVYLVGGGTHPGSGLPVIFESARITSRLLAEDLGLDRKGNP